MRPVPTVPLHDGRAIPQFGLGVYKVPEADTAELVAGAIRAGYRHVDTAALYRNERGVGEGVRRSGVPRDEVFVTSKVWNSDQGFDATLRACDASLAALGFDVIDLYLIHWPAPGRGLVVETWRALERLRADGRVRSIGVSNFEPHHLETLAAESDVVPVVNQVELHPLLPQRAVREYDEAHAIVTESWSPLARGRLLEHPIVVTLAAKHDATPAQILLAWHLALGLVVIPKSTSLDRVVENAGALGIELDEGDLAAIATMETGERTGLHPDAHDA